MLATPILGAEIRLARAMLGWSRGDLARRTGIEPAEVEWLEEEAGSPPAVREAVVAALAEAGAVFAAGIGATIWPPAHAAAQPVGSMSDHLGSGGGI